MTHNAIPGRLAGWRVPGDSEHMVTPSTADTSEAREAERMDRIAAAEDIRRQVDRVNRGDCVPAANCPVPAGWLG